MDNYDYVSLRRYNFGVRIKIIVEDADIEPPLVIQDIPE